MAIGRLFAGCEREWTTNTVRTARLSSNPASTFAVRRCHNCRTRLRIARFATVAGAVERYAGIGVRLEDSFLLLETELVRLSAKAPRTLKEIEELVRTR